MKNGKATLLANLTDVGNGRRLARHFGDDLRYVYALRKWLVWDGRRWATDDGAEIERRAKETARSIYREAQGTIDDAQRVQLAKWALQSESMRAIRAMIDAAKSEPGIAVEPGTLDKDRWLINCLNGTLDLRTGLLHPHSRADLITKLCPVQYDAHATCSTWLGFVDSIFAGDTNLIGYVQRLCGYWLTGDVREQILPVAWGGGSNGKSTLIKAFAKVLGLDYAITADQSIVMASKTKGSSTERMDLAGKRLALVIETDDGGEFAEAFVKQLTGGDAIRGRRMYENTFEFEPTHKVLLVTNHKPRVKATDHAFWRRVKLIHFGVTIPDENQDKALPEKLQSEAAGILAWALRGCLDWQRNGLGEPESVRRATAEYRAAEDVFGQFLADCCVLSPQCKAKLSDVLMRYRRWAEERGERNLTPRELSDLLTERGCHSYKNSVVWFRGVGISMD